MEKISKINYNTYSFRVDNLFSNHLKDDNLILDYEIHLNLIKEKLSENIRLLIMQINGNFPKNMILYQLIFCFELYLKYEMLSCFIYTSLQELKKYGHKIDVMIDILFEKTQNQIYFDIKNIINKIKINNNTIDFLRYSDYKYRFNESGILFKYDNCLKEEEKPIIMEVIECFKI